MSKTDHGIVNNVSGRVAGCPNKCTKGKNEGKANETTKTTKKVKVTPSIFLLRQCVYTIIGN